MMEFFRRKKPPPVEPAPLAPLAEAIGDAIIAAKDVQIEEEKAKLAAAQVEVKGSRVRLNLVLRAGERFRHAVELAGAAYETAADGVARDLSGQDD